MSKKINKADSQPKFTDIEKELLEWWYSKGIVDKYLTKNNNSEKRFTFIDGPITANNPMGVHHAWGRTYKDLWQRYKNMQGFKQRFQNGFDNQGLWVEVEVEKEKGFKTKKDIESYGIEKFVQDCKDATVKWSIVQREQSRRLGYFMNWGDYDGSDYSVIDENKYSYYTMASENNYTIWHFLKTCNEQGWIYEGVDGVPWCPRCGTAISQHEILTEEYQDVTHTSIFFKLPIKGKDNEYLLVWTTTPWTLVANVAVAVNPEFNYVKAKSGENIYYVLEDLVESVLGKDFEILDTILGKDLVGLKYEAPFSELEVKKNAQHEVVAWDMVGSEEGTGLVHIAPGCGKEDFDLGKELGLEQIMPIDDAGVYMEGFDWLTGMQVKDATPKIFEYMEKNGFLFKLMDYSHRYPKCWRCKTELLFRVVPEWFISMDTPGKDGRSLRERMIAAVSKDVKDGGTQWIPSFGQDRELDWLKNMHDWMISKKRYWGLALPIWTCSDCGKFEVIGSKEELKERAISGWEKFEGHTPHRPFIDEVKIKCEKCGKEMERIPDVGNPWLDAGIVPYSTLKYTQDREYWKEWFPADFVTECFPGQFKNWFYAMIAMSVALEDEMPFKTLLGHALVRDQNGEEMHKSKGNSIPFNDAADSMGADVMRWLYLRQNPVNDLNFGPKTADEVRRSFYLMLWNSYKFLTIYADMYNWIPSGKKMKELDLTVLDKWMLVRLENVIDSTKRSLDNYDSTNAVKDLELFVEDLSTWYIRRSRGRFADGDSVVLEVLYFVLVELVKLLAPFIPFVTETIYQNLVIGINDKALESIHLTDYPLSENVLGNLISDEDKNALVRDMETARLVVNSGQSARVASGMKVRQTLSKLEVKGLEMSKDILEIIAEELNVNDVVVKEKLSQGENWIIKSENNIEVALNIELSDKLKKEGLFRELTRQLQNFRKKSGLQMGELVKISWSTDSENIKEIFSDMLEELKETVSVSEFKNEYVEDMKVLNVNEEELKLKIVK